MNNNDEHNGSCSCGFVTCSINEAPLFTRHVIVMIVKNQQCLRLSLVQ